MGRSVAEPISSGGSSGQLPLRLLLCREFMRTGPAIGMPTLGHPERRFGVELDAGGVLGPRSLPEPSARSYEPDGGEVGKAGSVTMYCDDGRMGEPEGDSSVSGERNWSGTVRCWDEDGRATEGMPGSCLPRGDG